MSNDVIINVKAKDETSKTMGAIGVRAKTAGGAMAGAFTKVHAATALAAVGAIKVGQTLFRAGEIAAKGVGYAVSKASDMNETLNKSSVIFGKMQPVVAKFASTAAKDLGMSTQAAMESAASFGDMFLQLGFAGEQATRMSLNVVRLAADLGSFNNLPTADVQERIAAAFRGEYDSLQALVPTISAATVQQRAMHDTGKKNADSLTQQEKAAATLAIVMDSTARAQDDFKKTSTGLANSLKIARARLDDMAASAGKALLPFAKAGMKGFNHFLDRLQGSGALKKSLKGLANSLGDFVTSGDSATDTADSLADSFIDLAESTNKSFKGFNKANHKFADFVDGQREMVQKWRVKMLEGILTVLDAWSKINPRMKSVAKAVRKMLKETNQDVQDAANKTAKTKWEAKIKADKTDLEKKYRASKDRLEWLKKQKPTPKVLADIKKAEEKFRKVKYEMQQIDALIARPQIKPTYSGINKHNAGAPFHAAGGLVGGLGANHAAEGGPRGGRVWVGEQGPELVDLPLGSHVNSNPDSMAMAGKGGRSGIHITINAPNYVGAPADLLRALTDAKRRGQLDVLFR